MKKILSATGKTILTILLATLAAASTGYLLTPVYDFADPVPFSGDSIYNPYSDADPSLAKKAIFHFHTTRSDGKDSPEKIVGAYRNMGYDIVSISDHHNVTVTGIAPDRELRTYEHGLNAYRFHSVVFGVEQPSRYILPLWVNLSQRYETLKRLDESFDMVVLNHPGTVRRLSHRQVEQLSHYDYTEADNDLEKGTPPLWDAALSAGHYSFIMGNDDTHNLSKPYAIGRAMTFVMSSGCDAESVMDALKKGHCYALRSWHPSQNPDSTHLPRLTRVDFSNDTLRVAFSEEAEIRFIGQDGTVRKADSSVTASFYPFGQDDTYIRTEAHFNMAGRTIIYMNPVARYSPPATKPANASYASRNDTMTIVSIAAHALFMALCLACIYLLWRKRRHRDDVYRFR